MGLIKAASGAAGGVLADQWKEYFYCEALPAASPTGRISQIHRTVRCGTCLHRDCLHKENALDASVLPNRRHGHFCFVPSAKAAPGHGGRTADKKIPSERR